jgi:hypothetical protein
MHKDEKLRFVFLPEWTDVGPVDEGLVCQAFTGWTYLKRWNLSRGWLAPVPYSNKEGSFPWGFCKINGAVLKCTFFV